MAQNINLLTELPVHTVSALNSKLMAQIFIAWVLLLILIYAATLGINANKQRSLTELGVAQKNLLSAITTYNQELAPFQGKMDLKNMPTGSGNLLGFYRYLKDLAIFTPHGVWLNEFSFSEMDNSIIIKGSAVATSGASTLLGALDKSTNFHNKSFSMLQLQTNPETNNTDFVMSTIDSSTNPTTIDKK